MKHEYTDSEAAMIRDALRSTDTSPHCPRDGAEITYVVSGIRGVQSGVYETIWSVDVECVKCHATAKIDLTEKLSSF